MNDLSFVFIFFKKLIHAHLKGELDSQSLIPFRCESKLSTETVLFEPGYSADKSREILIAQSVHSPVESLFCSYFVNASNVEQVFKEHDIFGQLSQAEIAEQEFSYNVSNFAKLDSNMIDNLVSNIENDPSIKPLFKSDLTNWKKLVRVSKKTSSSSLMEKL